MATTKIRNDNRVDVSSSLPKGNTCVPWRGLRRLCAPNTAEFNGTEIREGKGNDQSKQGYLKSCRGNSDEKLLKQFLENGKWKARNINA